MSGRSGRSGKVNFPFFTSTQMPAMPNTDNPNKMNFRRGKPNESLGQSTAANLEGGGAGRHGVLCTLDATIGDTCESTISGILRRVAVRRYNWLYPKLHDVKHYQAISIESLNLPLPASPSKKALYMRVPTSCPGSRFAPLHSMLCEYSTAERGYALHHPPSTEELHTPTRRWHPPKSRHVKWHSSQRHLLARVKQKCAATPLRVRTQEVLQWTIAASRTLLSSASC